MLTWGRGGGVEGRGSRVEGRRGRGCSPLEASSVSSGLLPVLRSSPVISGHNTPVKVHVQVEAVLREQGSPLANAGNRAESLSWTVRLSDSAPHKKWVVLAAAVIAGVSGAVLLGQVLLGFLGFGIILASTAEYWLGVRYKVNETEAERRCGFSVSAIDWVDVKRVVVEGADILLSPLDEATRMDAFRGIVLKTTPENREQVIEAVKARVGDDVRLLG